MICAEIFKDDNTSRPEKKFEYNKIEIKFDISRSIKTDMKKT